MAYDRKAICFSSIPEVDEFTTESRRHGGDEPGQETLTLDLEIPCWLLEIQKKTVIETLS